MTAVDRSANAAAPARQRTSRPDHVYTSLKTLPTGLRTVVAGFPVFFCESIACTIMSSESPVSEEGYYVRRQCVGTRWCGGCVLHVSPRPRVQRTGQGLARAFRINAGYRTRSPLLAPVDSPAVAAARAYAAESAAAAASVAVTDTDAGALLLRVTAHGACFLVHEVMCCCCCTVCCCTAYR